jgi:hypothetical protein
VNLSFNLEVLEGQHPQFYLLYALVVILVWGKVLQPCIFVGQLAGTNTSPA